jgi:protein-disulfide isomerase
VLHGVDLTGVGYDQGSPTAPVVLVNFSDFGCPYCASFSRETYPAIERDYVKTGKVFFKYVPFVMGMFPNGKQAARAAECAAEEGRFWAMHDRLYADQRGWKRTRAPYELFQREAKAVGLDAGRFDACYAGDEVHPRTRRANAAAEALGVRVTPSFLVGDRGVEGALPLARFRELLDAALRDARP